MIGLILFSGEGWFKIRENSLETPEVEIKNLWGEIPEFVPHEVTEVLLETGSLRLERIVSGGQATPSGEWYDQETDEWVLLLKGSAGLRFEGDAEVRVMRPGDALHIPAHRRHRVEWTESEGKTVWLALHYLEEKKVSEK